MDPDSQTNTTSTCSRALGFRNASRLCQACRDGYSRTSNSRCKDCKFGGVGNAMIFLITGVTLLFIGFAVLIGMKLRSFGQSEFKADRRKKTTHSTLKRIILSHVQTVSLVLGLAVPWPEIMLNTLSFLSSVSTFSENANGVECLISGVKNHAAVYYALLTCMAIMPIAFIALLMLFWYGVAPCVAYLNSNEDGSPKFLAKAVTCGTRMQHGPLRLPAMPPETTGRFLPSYADAFTASSVLCWFLVLPSLMRVGFGVFQCRSVGNPDVDFLVVSMQERCWGGHHFTFAFLVGVPMLLLYAVMVPVLILLRLHRAKLARGKSPNLLLRFGLLYSGYRPQKFWWELVVLMRKYSIIAASTIIVSDKNQLQIVLGVVIVALHMHDSNEPFGRSLPAQRLLHRFEMMSLLLLTFLVWSGLYFSSFSHLCTTTQSGACTICVILVLVLNVGYLVLVAGKCCSEFCKRNSHVARNLAKKLGRVAKKINKESVELELTESAGNPLYGGKSGGRSGGTSNSKSVGGKTAEGTLLRRSFGGMLGGKGRDKSGKRSAPGGGKSSGKSSATSPESSNPLYGHAKPQHEISQGRSSLLVGTAGTSNPLAGTSHTLAGITGTAHSLAGTSNPLAGVPSVVGEWLRHYDEASARWYLNNRETGESKWEGEKEDTVPSLEKRKKKRYSEYMTSEGKSFFVSESGDGETVWELPADGTLAQEYGEDAEGNKGGGNRPRQQQQQQQQQQQKKKKKRYSEFMTVEGQSYFVSESGDGETLWALPDDAMLA